jgi:hypothetical protein
VAGKGVLALPTGKQTDVGPIERYIYPSSGGKEECVNSKRNNTMADMPGGGEWVSGAEGLSSVRVRLLPERPIGVSAGG